ncbi:MAG: hypothetical protein RIQ74_1862 [Pseudomonadota bacterium]
MQKIVNTIYTAFTSENAKYRYEIHSEYIRDSIILRKINIILLNIVI